MKFKGLITALAAAFCLCALPFSYYENSAHADEAEIKINSILNGGTYTINSKFKGYEIQNGIDVSKWQSDIDWEGLKDEGIDFAIIRLGYRSTSASGAIYIDNYYKQNIQGANDADVPAGVYFYSQATTKSEAIAEAKYCIDNLKGYNLQLPIVMDFEYAWANGGHSGRLYDAHLTRDEATEVILAFLDTVKAAGYEGMLYANKSTLNDSMHAEKIENKYPVWLAHYTTDTDYEGEYLIWQYSDTGTLKSIDGSVDCNFMFLPQSLESISFEQEIYTVEQGTRFTMDCVKTPSGCTEKLTWKTSNPAVGYFSKTTSTLVCVSPGTTTITVTSESGLMAQCKVVVKKSLANAVSDKIGDFTYNASSYTPDADIYETVFKDAKTSTSAPLHVKPSRITSKVITLDAGTPIEILGKDTVDGYSFFAACYDDGITKFYGYINCDYVDYKEELRRLSQGAHYTKEYLSNTNKGTASVVYTSCCDEFIGSYTASFNILPASLDDAVILEIPNQKYSGNPITPVIRISFGGTFLTLGKDYTASYSDCINAGTAKVIITGKGNFKGSITKNYSIVSSALTDISLFGVSASDTAIGSDGKLIEPTVTVTSKNGKELSQGRDYLLSFVISADGTSGRAYAVGIGSYTGIASGSFKLSGIDISDFDITVLQDRFEYTGYEITPDVTITDANGNTLREYFDYTLKYKNNVLNGRATVIAEGKGVYTGTVSAGFDISPADISSAVIILGNDSFGYTGSAIKPGITVSFGGLTLKKGTDYTVSYSNNTNIGRGYVVINGIGSFSGNKSVGFSIVPKKQVLGKITSAAEREISVSVAVDKLASGYEIAYSSKSTFVGGLTVKTNNCDTTTVSFQKGLVIGKTYYIKARSYVVLGNSTLYGDWSDVSEFQLRPKKATLLKVYIPSKRTVAASWLRDSNATGYEVNYSSKPTFVGGLSVDIPTNTQTSVSFKNGIVIGRTYYVRVRSYKILGDIKVYGDWSDVLNITLYPDKPTIDSVYSPGHRTLAAVWTSDTTVSGYEVGYSSKASFEGGLSVTVEGKENITAAFQRGLVVGRTYYIRLRSYKSADGKTVYSDWSDAVTIKLQAQKPQIASLSSPSSRTIKATWKYDFPADGYEINYSSKSTFAGGLTVLTKNPSQVSEQFKSGLVIGRNYYVRVRSYKVFADTTYYSDWSDVVQYKLMPQPPKITSVSSPATRRIYVTWEKDTEISGYEVNYGSKTTFEGGKVVDVTKNSTTSTTFQSGLVVGRKYYIRIRSYKLSGTKKIYSDWSKVMTYTCK